jgi:hypothetical protein
MKQILNWNKFRICTNLNRNKFKIRKKFEISKLPKFKFEKCYDFEIVEKY